MDRQKTINQSSVLTLNITRFGIIESSVTFFTIFVTVGVGVTVVTFVACELLTVASIDGGGRSWAFSWCRFGLFCITARHIS